MTFRSVCLLAALALTACADKSDSDTEDTGADTEDTGADTDTDTDPDTDPDTDTDPEPADYAARGPHAVGYTVLDDDGRTVKVWYPTASDEAEEIEYLSQVRMFGPDSKPMPFYGAAIADADPELSRGPYPLVVLSHGFGMNPEWYHSLAEHLTSHGYVVMGPEHVEYDWYTDVIPATVERPQVVSDTIDFAETSPLGGAIDVDHVAVVGHSYGGTTALLVGGARIQTDWMTEECALNEDPFVADFFCDTFLDNTEQLAEEMGLHGVPDGMWPSMVDTRVDAIVAMAPDAFMFGEVGLAEVEIPMMALGGTGDTAALWSWGGGLAYDSVSSDTRAMVAFEGSEHFIVTTTCDNMPWTAALPEMYSGMFCTDPTWDKAEALDITNETVTAFVAYTLSGDAEGREALSPSLYAGIDGLEVRFEETVSATSLEQGRRQHSVNADRIER